MRILLAASMYPPEIGGPATYAKLLVERLPSRGIEVDLLPFSSVRRFPRGIRHVVYTWKIFSRARKADLVFVQDTVSTGLPVALAAFFARRPFILRVPGDYAWEQGRQRFDVRDSLDDFQTKRYGFRIACLRMVQKFVVARASVVIVPSAYFGGIVSAWGVGQDRLRVIYNSIDIGKPIPPAAKPAGHTMVSVGRFVPWKGFDALIGLLPQLPEWNLVLIGNGPERSNLEEKARTLGVEGRVTFTGALSHAEVFGWYEASDAFVLNTSFESFSYQVAEALTVGVPVIATNIGSLPELVENGKEGGLVAPDDMDAIQNALKSVVDEPELWKKRVEAGKVKARLFNPETMLEKFVAVCKSLKQV